MAFVRGECATEGNAELARAIASLLEHEGTELFQKLRLSKVSGSTGRMGGWWGRAASLRRCAKVASVYL